MADAPIPPILAGHHLVRRFGDTTAVNDVSFSINAGERVGIVGESGSGKSTLGRLLLRLEQPHSGTIEHNGVDVTKLPPRRLLPFRRACQVVFQNPAGALNPRLTVADIVAEGLTIHGLFPERDARRARVVALLAEVGLDERLLERLPHELSGGQKQRVGIARALAVEPRLLLLDEPVSALDVSIQAQVINLLASLSSSRQLALVFIAHDLHVVRHLCERIAVMQQGQLVEQAETETLFASPQHPYTQALLASTPGLKRAG
jgi:ABC-type oligopeptide transport system ATPase subunit